MLDPPTQAVVLVAPEEFRRRLAPDMKPDHRRDPDMVTASDLVGVRVQVQKASILDLQALLESPQAGNTALSLRVVAHTLSAFRMDPRS